MKDSTTVGRGAEGLIAPDLTLDMNRLRLGGTDVVLLAGVVFWMIYMVNGFRLPTAPIEISDKNAGATVRQLVFSACGGIALFRLLCTRCLGPILVLRWPMVCLIGLIFLSCLWSERPELTIKRGIIFVFGALSLMVLVHGSKRPTALMLRTVVFFVGVVASLSILFYIVLPTACTVNPARPGLAGVSVHPNTLAPFLSIGLILSFAFRAETGVDKLMLRVSQIASGMALFMAFSVTTLATTMIGVGIYVFLVSSSYRRGVIQLLAIGIISVVSVVGLQTVKGELFDAAGRDESLSGRGDLWQAVQYEIEKTPMVGHGFGSFWVEGKGRELVQTWNPRQSHHAYLDVLLDLGVLGLIIVILLFVVRLLLAWPRVSGCVNSDQRRASGAMIAVAFSYMVFYAFGQSYLLRFDAFPFFVLFWITLLITNRDRNCMESEYEYERGEN